MAAARTKHLVIVESPAKARTLERYLGDGYAVEASIGHVMDLPKSGLGVDVENDFEPEYVPSAGKEKVLRALRKAAMQAEEILLATDPDREGEAIAYDIAHQLGYVPGEQAGDGGNGGRFQRITFHEITREAVLEALEHPGEIDLRRVEAQRARRILDRLVGYKLSPLLWKKILPGLSAGRVQSVAVRLLVLRERERRAFHSARYFDLRATLAPRDDAARPATFPADLWTLGGKRLATGKDFDEATGRLAKGRDVVLLGEEEASALGERLREAEFRVDSIDVRHSSPSPYPPFTTSSLQQEANRKLNLSASRTMSIAQALYQAGHITYMRTDSVNLSEQAIRAARGRVESLYGADYLSPEPRRYRGAAKGAQEAHEAIRPAGTRMRTSDELGLQGRERALYDLIWKRTVASQMANARQRHITAMIRAGDAEFRAVGKVLEFAGFFRAYVEGSDDPDAALEDREIPLPELGEGDVLDCRELEAQAHETKPPARYTEATLVKELESDGIGRPSTYASIISTIVDRGYVERSGKQLVPTYTAFAVTGLLEEHFSDLVDTGFTAAMEDALDDIAAGSVEWRAYLRGFYQGEQGFEARLTERQDQIDPRQASTVELEGLEPRVRIGRYGPFLELSRNGESITASVPGDVAPGDLTNEQAIEALERKAQGPRILGEDPESGEPVLVLVGRYGPYVQLGETGEAGTGKKGAKGKKKAKSKPSRTSLPEGMSPEEVTLPVALRLLSMPYEVGKHPETDKSVKVGIGRYGPYVVHEGDFRSLEAEDNVLDVPLERTLELLARPKSRGRRGAKQGPARELGAHPADGEPVRALSGRYGPYVKHGKTNASLPKGMSLEEVTLEKAIDLLAARREQKGGARGPSRKKKKTKTSKPKKKK